MVRRHGGREAAAVISGFCGQDVRAASLLVIHLFVYLFNSLIHSFICLHIFPFADSYRTADLQKAFCLGKKDLGWILDSICDISLVMCQVLQHVIVKPIISL